MRVLCGDKTVFAIEYEILDETDPPECDPVGDLWFWIDGRQVGNTDCASYLGIGFDGLASTLQFNGLRTNRSLYIGDKDHTLDTVFQNIYSDDGPGDVWDRDYKRFLILEGVCGNEWVDGWDRVLIEGETPDTMDRVLYRGPDKVAYETWWQSGLYERVVRQAVESLVSNSKGNRPLVDIHIT